MGELPSEKELRDQDRKKGILYGREAARALMAEEGTGWNFPADLLEAAMGLLCNVDQGNWGDPINGQTQEWGEAAARWLKAYNEALSHGMVLFVQATAPEIKGICAGLEAARAAGHLPSQRDEITIEGGQG